MFISKMRDYDSIAITTFDDHKQTILDPILKKISVLIFIRDSIGFQLKEKRVLSMVLTHPKIFC